MSAGAQIDYEALAKQAGAISSQSAGGVDYEALAKQAGAISSQSSDAPKGPEWPLMKQQGESDQGYLTRALDAMKSMSPEQQKSAMSDWGKQPGGGAIVGLQDIGRGDIAKGLHRILLAVSPTVAAATLPLTGPAALANPGTTIAGVAGGYLGQRGAKKGAEYLGATPDQADLAGDVGGAAGAVASGYAASKVGSLIPSTAHAGQQLQDVRATAGNIPIDTSKAGDTALQLYEQSQRGAVLPKSVRQFVMRVTAPDSEPITYAEAKDFQSNVSRLSANERMNLNPNTARLVGQLNANLKASLTDAAEVSGKGQQFVDAMKEYHNAMRLKGFTDAAIKAAIGAAIGGLGIAGAKTMWNALTPKP